MGNENQMVRGITFVLPNVMPELSFESIRSRFDDTLTNLYHKIPKETFYLGKVWVNLERIQTIQDILSYNFDYVFYSPYAMEIEMSQIMYMFGKPIVVMKSALSRIEATDGDSTYYIYQAKLPYESCEKSYVDELIKLKNEYGYHLVQKVAQNQGRLIVLTDLQTNEVLFVSAILAEYVPNFTGYQFCRVVG
uniref:YAP binding domain-containing protein n=1 Tax=Acrobeloides nanus TaxID=290746 RepID=A0A914DA36_9BILA